jgi:hypothetical protein
MPLPTTPSGSGSSATYPTYPSYPATPSTPIVPVPGGSVGSQPIPISNSIGFGGNVGGFGGNFGGGCDCFGDASGFSPGFDVQLGGFDFGAPSCD